MLTTLFNASAVCFCAFRRADTETVFSLITSTKSGVYFRAEEETNGNYNYYEATLLLSNLPYL